MIQKEKLPFINMQNIIDFFSKVGLLLLSIISPVQAFIAIVFTVVIIDTCFAVYYVQDKYGWSSFSSNKLFNIVPKLFFYFGTIIIAYQIDLHFFEGELKGIKILFTKIVCGMWIFIECKSMDETSVKLGHPPVLDLITNLIKRVKEFKKDINEQ